MIGLLATGIALFVALGAAVGGAVASIPEEPDCAYWNYNDECGDASLTAKASATVTSVDATNADVGDYYADLSFPTATGQTRAPGLLWSVDRIGRRPRVGDRVDIRYDPANPEEAVALAVDVDAAAKHNATLRPPQVSPIWWWSAGGGAVTTVVLLVATIVWARRAPAPVRPVASGPWATGPTGAPYGWPPVYGQAPSWATPPSVPPPSAIAPQPPAVAPQPPAATSHQQPPAPPTSDDWAAPF